MSFEDRRDYYRLPIRVPVFIRGVDAKGEEFLELTHTINVSASGACLISKRDLAVSTDVLISIPAPLSADYDLPEDREFRFPAKVIRSDNELSPAKKVSVRFAKLLYEKS